MSNKKEIITELLKDLGIPVHLTGFHQIRYAIELLMEDFSLSRSITKSLYPAVAKECGVTDYQAERTMRHVIYTGWARGNVRTQNKLFGYTVDADKGVPTNSEFLCTVADYLKLVIGADDDETV